MKIINIYWTLLLIIHLLLTAMSLKIREYITVHVRYTLYLNNTRRNILLVCLQGWMYYVWSNELWWWQKHSSSNYPDSVKIQDSETWFDRSRLWIIESSWKISSSILRCWEFWLVIMFWVFKLILEPSMF